MDCYRLNLKFISLILLVFTEFSQCDNPWLKMVLQDGSQYYFFEPNQCQHGIYLQNPIDPVCICARGVWMFKKDMCEPRGKPGYIIAANDARSAFKWKSGHPIKYLRYFGNYVNWKEQTAFVADKHFSRFEKMQGVHTKTKAGFTNIMIINPTEGRSEIRDCGDTMCFAPEGGTFETQCPPKDCTPWTASAGVVWKEVDNKTGYWFNTEDTPETCNVENQYGGISKVPHDRNFVRLAWGAGYVLSAPYGDSFSGRCEMDCAQPDIETFPPDHNGAIYIDKNGVIYPTIPTTTTTSPLTTSNTTIDTNSTTETNTTTTAKPPTNDSSLYKHLDPQNPDLLDPQYSYSPDCADLKTKKYNPLSTKQKTEVREQTLRMVKLHYNVILNGKRTPEVKVPEYELFQTSRLIMEKVCPQQEVPKTLLRSFLRMFRMALNETQGDDKYPYLVISDLNSIKRLQKSLASCLNVESKKQFTFEYKQCSREYIHINITNIAVKALVPCELQYNTTHYDYVVEAAWKTLMFVHYYCAEYFDSEQYDHSRLEFILQKFFNRNIMHRWFQQGKSAELFEYIFRTFDLKTFKEGMDRCVAGARSVSPYKKWLRRPSYDIYCRGEMEGESQPKGLVRSKRANLGKHKSVFKGQGICLRNFDEVVSVANYPCSPITMDPICYPFRDVTTTTVKPTGPVGVTHTYNNGKDRCIAHAGYTIENGWDLAEFFNSDIPKCCEYCSKNPKCNGWTWANNACYLKRTGVLERSTTFGNRITSGYNYIDGKKPDFVKFQDQEYFHSKRNDKTYATCSIHRGQIRGGKNLNVYSDLGPQECCQKCSLNSACTGYSYNENVQGRCILKSSVEIENEELTDQALTKGVVVVAGRIVSRNSAGPWNSQAN